MKNIISIQLENWAQPFPCRNFVHTEVYLVSSDTMVSANNQYWSNFKTIYFINITTSKARVYQHFHYCQKILNVWIWTIRQFLGLAVNHILLISKHFSCSIESVIKFNCDCNFNCDANDKDFLRFVNNESL